MAEGRAEGCRSGWNDTSRTRSLHCFSVIGGQPQRSIEGCCGGGWLAHNESSRRSILDELASHGCDAIPTPTMRPESCDRFLLSPGGSRQDGERPSLKGTSS